MTVTAPETPASPRPRRSSRRFKALAVAASVVIVLGVAFAFLAQRWTSPSLFGDGDAGTFSVDAQPLANFPLYVGFGSVDADVEETVTVDSADVHFSDNSAGFTAKMFVCTQRPVKDGSLRVGATTSGPLSEYCTSVRPLKDGTRVHLQSDLGEYLVAAFTPARAGTAHVDSINIHYSRGSRHFFQRGTQHVGQDFTIAAKN